MTMEFTSILQKIHRDRFGGSVQFNDEVYTKAEIHLREGLMPPSH